MQHLFREPNDAMTIQLRSAKQFRKEQQQQPYKPWIDTIRSKNVEPKQGTNVEWHTDQKPDYWVWPSLQVENRLPNELYRDVKHQTTNVPEPKQAKQKKHNQSKAKQSDISPESYQVFVYEPYRVLTTTPWSHEKADY